MKKKKRFIEEQIIGVLKEADAGLKVVELCRKHGLKASMANSGTKA